MFVMTVQKAIKILDWWITQKHQAMETLQEKWKNSDDSYGISKTLLDYDQVIVSNLESIKKELVPKCKHPKNMRDKIGNQWYCMNCNFDL